MNMRLWKCRSLESTENQEQVFRPSHRPWKSRSDFHLEFLHMSGRRGGGEGTIGGFQVQIDE